ncbi:50S ribosomal protein L18 [Oxobacter pfennigii]|uniref:Large ribosomal subunit protein uL18 n=1 Tax=Oxobacter pfennigii TaxID=36849 RepID=A0A0P8W257_9CLOT|nr:50S ribosomal protein L18 [Oxobacter pfennigii]KPU42617.1 50S ribosomal protein L18 [Oxobacter pfennigii]
MLNKPVRNEARIKRHMRSRNKIHGTAERPRLNVFRSEKNIYAQIINDDLGRTLVAASSLDKELKETISAGSNKEAAKAVGELIAKKAKEAGLSKVVFDRGGYIYHGRVKELAEAARQAGLEF